MTSAPTPPPAPITDLDVERVAEFCDRLEDYGYSFSLLVAAGAAPVLERACGFADHSTRRPMTADTPLAVASLAKQFTATAVLKLASEGTLPLSTPLADVLPDAPGTFAGITVDHLLAHTSGIVDDYDLYAKTPDLPQAAWLQRLFARPLDGRPGEAWRYSNDGYSLLALLVEHASGRPFRRYVHDALFGPVGMPRTGFALEPHLRERAVAWGGEEPSSWFLDRWAGGLGASDIWSTPRDLWAWDTAMRTDTLLPPEWRAKLFEPQIEVFSGFHYARGWWVRRSERGTRIVFHSGREEDGFSAWYVRFVDEGVTAIFASNQSVEVHPLREAFFGGVLSNVEKLLFGGGHVVLPAPVTSSPDPPGVELAGCYDLADGSTLTVRDRSPWLEVTPSGQSAFELLMPETVDAAARHALRRMTTSTERLVDSLAHGDEAPFVAAVGERDDLYVMPVPELGPYRVLGTYPLRVTISGAVTGVTYVETSTGLHRFQWSDQTLSRHYVNHAPVLPLFRPVSATEWCNWQPFLEGGGRLDLGSPRWSRSDACAGRAPG